MAWLKGAHIAALAVWCACLFYLPALLAEVVRAKGSIALRRSHIMARVTYVAIASPAAVIAIITGTILAFAAGAGGLWLVAKLTVVAAMVFFHLHCGRLVSALDRVPRLANTRGLIFLIVVPAVLVPVTLWLVMGKPF